MFDDQHLSKLCAHFFVTRLGGGKGFDGPFLLPRGSPSRGGLQVGSFGVPRFVGSGVAVAESRLSRAMASWGMRGGRGEGRRASNPIGCLCAHCQVCILSQVCSLSKNEQVVPSSGQLPTELSAYPGQVRRSSGRLFISILPFTLAKAFHKGEFAFGCHDRPPPLLGTVRDDATQVSGRHASRRILRLSVYLRLVHAVAVRSVPFSAHFLSFRPRRDGALCRHFSHCSFLVSSFAKGLLAFVMSM